MQKNRHLGTIAQLCPAVSSQLRHVSTIGKNFLNSNISPTCPHNMANFGPVTAEIVLVVWCTPAISTGFASCLHYCSDVTHQRPTKLCSMFGHLLCWYIIYAFSGDFACHRIHFTSKSCVLLYWQRYCTTLEQRASAKLCVVVQEMELCNFHSSPFSTEGATYISRAAIMLGIGPHSIVTL